MTNQMLVEIGLKALIFMLLLLAAYWFLQMAYRFEPVKRLKEKMDDMDRKRLLDGKEKKDSFFERYLDSLDERLTQAGVKKVIPKAAVEIYVLFNLLEFTLVFCFMKKGILIPLMVAALTVYINKFVVDLLRYRNKKKIEGQLLEFMNLVSDYSLSESEITMILYKCGLSMSNPLKRLLVNCHLAARASGNSEQALLELRRSADHFLFREILLLMELCSHSDGDYQKVINGCRDMVNRYLQEEKEKASVVRALIGEAAIMTGVAVFGVRTMLKEFAGGIVATDSMTDFFFHHPAGQVSLVVYAALALGMVQIILKFAKR